MSGGSGKCRRIRHIVRLRQMVRRWRDKARATLASRPVVPCDVPAGHVAVRVGSSCTRFVVRASYLNHPAFKKLLDQAAEAYGFANHGPLSIPCDESAFEEAMRFISLSDLGRSKRFADVEDVTRCPYVDGGRRRCKLESRMESRPLLQRFAESRRSCRAHDS